MAAVKELLRAENDGSLSFGDYTLSEKTKKDNYEFEECEYEVFIDGESAGKMRTNLSGKLSVSVELSEGQEATMRVVKC